MKRKYNALHHLKVYGLEYNKNLFFSTAFILLHFKNVSRVSSPSTGKTEANQGTKKLSSFVSTFITQLYAAVKCSNRAIRLSQY